MRKTVTGAMSVLLFTSMFILAFNIGLVRAQAETVYINSDGSVSPFYAPISSVDNVTYTFTGNISYPSYNGIVIERNNIVIDGNGYTMQGNQNIVLYGISLTDISNVTIENANIQSFAEGIYLESSSNNTILGNNITASGGIGIELDSSSSNMILENNVTNLGAGIPWEAWIGIWLMSSTNNTILENNITGEIYAISLSPGGLSGTPSSSFNTISGNNVADNEYGIAIGYWINYMYKGDCSNNTIYHNNFIDNSQQVLNGGSSNAWDNGYPSGGNYWSDYNGTDVYRGVYQNVTGSDGVGDTPYVIDANNTDNYPLMKPYPWGSHDIGVAYVGEVFGPLVSPLKTVIGLGYTLNISAFVMSYGSYPEVFNATIYVNNTVIGTVANVTLASDCSVILNFTWDTSGLAYGNYTISAYVTPVPGQTDMTENTRAVSVYVGIPGDLNGDSTVDIYDAILLSAAFNSSPGSTNWNPNADINGDGIVDIYDAIIQSAYFGQSIP